MSLAPWSRGLPISPWIRLAGHAFGPLSGSSTEEISRQLIDNYRELDFDNIHVWQRDRTLPGWHGFEPGPTELVREMEHKIREELGRASDNRAEQVGSILPIGTKTLDLIQVDENRWWVGTHRAESLEQTWPGGVFPMEKPATMLSRAYLKVAEALVWSQWDWNPGDRIVEIGSAPGGACQRLLELGFHVTGVDPAEMDPTVLGHPRFTHWRARSLQVKRRQFSGFRWLLCDANVAPNYTLDTVEGIVTYPTSQFQGLILTIKLSDWEQASKISEHLSRVASWGFSDLRARQLSYNRREYCLVAKR